MKIIISFLTMLISLLFNPIYSQDKTSDQEIVAQFQISNARKNGVDITPTILDQKGKLVIYKDVENNNTLCLSNFWEKKNSQSYGPVYDMKIENFPEDDENYKADIFCFQWSYTNTYDTKKGTAKVELLEVYKPQGTYFKMTIIPENLDILVYEGYVEGSLDLLVYERKN